MNSSRSEGFTESKDPEFANPNCDFGSSPHVFIERMPFRISAIPKFPGSFDSVAAALRAASTALRMTEFLVYRRFFLATNLRAAVFFARTSAFISAISLLTEAILSRFQIASFSFF